jgi:hypothetical protein
MLHVYTPPWCNLISAIYCFLHFDEIEDMGGCICHVGSWKVWKVSTSVVWRIDYLDSACCSSSMGTRTRRPPEGTSSSASTSVPSFGVAEASRAATRDIKKRPLSHRKNAKSAKAKVLTKHVQDTEHLRPLSEHLAMHYSEEKKLV